jgi:co-chaperonin GroES (HSP10)
LKVGTNHIAIELRPRNSGVEFMSIIDDFDVGKHFNVRATVVGVGDKFFNFEHRNHLIGDEELMSIIADKYNYSLPYDVDDDIMVGDEVIFFYGAHLGSFEGHMIFVHNDKWVAVINRDLVYATIRDGVVTPVNGYILVEPDHSEKVKHGVSVPVKRKTAAGKGTVVFAGPQPVASKEDGPLSGLPVVQQGARILYRAWCPRIEYEYHNTLNYGGSELVKVRYDEILAFL